MLTTSPSCSARHSSSRIVRTSTRTVSPFCEISPEFELTHQAPMRSFLALGCSIRDRLLPPTCSCIEERPRRVYQHRGGTPTAFRTISPLAILPQSRTTANAVQFQKYSEC